MTTVTHLTPADLARRWRVSPRTLERWRWTGEGPRYCKPVGRILYRLEDIEAFELSQMRDCTAQNSSPYGRAGA
ncbi:MAG: hypothetical protein PsegKO_34770 [Pseudohongiellaceae bacterium]